MIRRVAAAAFALALMAATPATAQPPVWVVRDADSELVLFGAVHVLPPGLDWRPAALDRAVAGAEDLWFEIPVDPAAEAEVARLAVERGLLAPNQSLSAMLSPEGAGRLAAAARRFGVDPALFDRLEPWFAEVALAGLMFRAAGADAASGVERAVAASARAQARRRALETPEEQIAIFDGAPLAEQLASLEASLKELTEHPAAYDDLIAAWLAGDLRALEDGALVPLREAAPGLYERLVTARNRRWTEQLRARLEGRGRTVVVVGVGHLVGADGLPARLRALGYSVEGP